MKWETLRVRPSDYVVRNGLSRGDQAQILDELSMNPLKGYCFMGPTGVGKSFLMYCLAIESAYAGRRTLFRKTNAWMDAARTCATDRDADPPAMIFMETELVKTISGPTHLFLDEIENIPPSDFSSRTMFSLLDYCYENADSVVLTVASNKDLEEWGKIFGDASARRIQCLTKPILMSSGGK
jgi:DNA replication protein DnaC